MDKDRLKKFIDSCEAEGLDDDLHDDLEMQELFTLAKKIKKSSVVKSARPEFKQSLRRRLLGDDESVSPISNSEIKNPPLWRRWAVLTPVVVIAALGALTLTAAASPDFFQKMPVPLQSALRDTNLVTRTGFLEIDSVPNFATVIIDGEEVGETPLSKYELKIGSHLLKLERDGYLDYSEVIKIISDEKTVLNLDLQKIIASADNQNATCPAVKFLGLAETEEGLQYRIQSLNKNTGEVVWGHGANDQILSFKGEGEDVREMFPSGCEAYYKFNDQPHASIKNLPTTDGNRWYTIDQGWRLGKNTLTVSTYQNGELLDEIFKDIYLTNESSFMDNIGRDIIFGDLRASDEEIFFDQPANFSFTITNNSDLDFYVTGFYLALTEAHGHNEHGVFVNGLYSREATIELDLKARETKTYDLDFIFSATGNPGPGNYGVGLDYVVLSMPHYSTQIQGAGTLTINLQ